MLTLFRLVVLLMTLVGTGACQSNKIDPDTALKPGSPELELLYQEGRTAYLSEDYQTAAAIFERVVNIDPTHINALINWGVSLSRDGKPKEAIPKFEQALARDPNHAWAKYNLGVALERLGEHEAAITQYKQAIELSPAILTPEMVRYFERKGSKQQENAINLQESPAPSMPR
jgi:tetratricopeptide (TPR) repeat protein